MDVSWNTTPSLPITRAGSVQAKHPNKAEHFAYFISNYWLPTGYLVLLTGLFWLPERSLYSKSYYALIALPSLLLLFIQTKRLTLLLREPIILTYIIFSTWLIISTTWNNSEHQLLSLTKRPIYVFMLFAGCAAMAVSQAKLSLRRSFFFAAILIVPAAAYNLFIYFSDSVQLRLIGSGSLSNPLLTSHLLGLFCTYWFARWTFIPQQQMLAITCGFTLFITLLATGSRTPLLALASTCIWLATIRPTRRTVVLTLTLIVATAVILAWAPEIIMQRGLSYRPNIWSEAFRQYLESPWLGKGYGSPLSIQVAGLSTVFSDPHNIVLAIALELGAAGLLLWCLMYAVALGTCIRHRTNADFSIASAMLIYGLMSGMTEGSNFLSRPNESWFLTWIPLALLAGLSIRDRLDRPTNGAS